MSFWKRKRKEAPAPRAKETVESFSVITIEMTSTSSRVELEVVRGESTAEVSVYDKRWGSDERHLRGRAECDTDTVLAILNECDLMGLDGFNGERPPDLLDGETFMLNATVNGERRISARGSGCSPEGIDKLESKLFDIVREKGQMNEGRGAARM